MITPEFIRLGIDVFKQANRLDLAEQLNDLRGELLTLGEENLQPKTQNADLKSKLEVKAKVIFEQGICWLQDDEMTKDKSKTPICPKCYQVNGTVVRSYVTNIGSDGYPYIDCCNCSATYLLAR